MRTGNSRHSRRLRISVAAVLAASGPTMFASAVEKQWQGTEQDTKWSTPGNWREEGRPAAGDDVIIERTPKVTIDISPTVKTMELRGTRTGADLGGAFNLTVTDVLSFAGVIVEGEPGPLFSHTGTGTVGTAKTRIGVGANVWGGYEQSDGKHTTAALSLGLGDRTASGSYWLTGKGVVDVTDVAVVGADGWGSFFQGGAATKHTVTNTLVLGLAANSQGSYTLADGTVGANKITVGSAGSGSFSHQKGNILVADTLFLGLNPDTGSGTYTLSGGELHALNETIGSNRNGTFTQTGGKNIVNVLNVTQGEYVHDGGELKAKWIRGEQNIIRRRGNMVMDDGVIEGDGAGTVEAAYTIEFGGAAGNTLRLPAMNNAGVIAVLGGGNLNLDGAALRNSGVLDLRTDAGVAGSGTLANSGTIRKSGGAGTSTIGVSFSGSSGGTIDVRSGSLHIPNASAGAYWNKTGSGNLTVEITGGGASVVAGPVEQDGGR